MEGDKFTLEYSLRQKCGAGGYRLDYFITHPPRSEPLGEDYAANSLQEK